jgi:polyhydroxyalkanoate synthesis regulator phasin
MNNSTPNLSDSMEGFHAEKIDYSRFETSFRRWLVLEIDAGRMSIPEARKRFNLPNRFDNQYKRWQKKYSDEIHLSLSTMDSKDRVNNEKLEQRIKELEKQLEKAQMKNVALNTLIDIAENELKISIRKKPGAKL